MADPTLTAEEIAEMARDPQSHTVDGEQTVSRSADDIIKLDEYAAQKAKTRQAVKFLRMVPPDARGGSC